MKEPFTTWLAEVTTDDVTVRPDDIDAEAIGNLWTFSLDPSQIAVVCSEDVESFATCIVEARRERLSARGVEPMLMYWWHDAQAGQLRFSMVSAIHGRLPFRARLSRAEGLGVIVDKWLAPSHPHGISSSEFQTPADEANAAEHLVDVWSIIVP